MSSISRHKALNGGLTTKYANISTPCYLDGPLDEDIPIPFTVSTGVIDIAITNASVQTFISNGSSPDDDSFYQAKSMGGYRLANIIGPNFETYLRNFITSNDGLGSTYAGPLTVKVAATMSKVQIAQPGNVAALQFERAFGVNDFPPSSDSYAGGDATLNYYTTFVFTSPLTIEYTSADSTTGYRYITFSTHYDGD